MHKSITEARLIEAVKSGDYIGFCLACGAEAHGVEPDANDYPCEECKSNKVYGAEEILLVML